MNEETNLSPELKKNIDNFFEIKPGTHITLENTDFDFVEDMLNKSSNESPSLEQETNRYKDIVIELYRKVLGRYPNNIELAHYSNMLKYELISKEEILTNIENSDEYIRKHSPQQPPVQIPQPPVQISQPPVQVSQPPVQISQPPVQISQPPVQISQPSSQHTDEYYIEIIKKVYDEELRREADEGGIANYLKHMKKGMTETQLRKSLRNSPEYRENFGVYVEQQVSQPRPVPIYQQPQTQINVPSQTNIPLVYCMMGTNRLNEIKPYIETILPYIDRLMFIDGGSEDGTAEYLIRQLGNKVEVYAHPWQDRFSEQRNNYLAKLRERNYNGWCVTSDTDEHYPVESLKQIRDIIPEIEAKGYNGIKVQVEDIEVDNDDFNKIISRNINQYWKPLIYKFHPNIRYEGEPHETLTGHPIKWYKSNIIYEHRRSKLHILQRATENYFISNSNRYSERWAEFRFLCTKHNLLNFKDYWNLFKEHKLPKEVEDWIYSHKDDNQDSGDSEIREQSLLYFEVLPERMKKQSKRIELRPKESDRICTIPELKQKPEITPESTQADIQRLIQENIALRTELNKALQRITDLTMSSEKVQPRHLTEESKEVINKFIDKAITKSFENDSIYEIVPPDSIYIVRIIKSEADIIENRNGEATYKRIKLQE